MSVSKFSKLSYNTWRFSNALLGLSIVSAIFIPALKYLYPVMHTFLLPGANNEPPVDSAFLLLLNVFFLLTGLLVKNLVKILLFFKVIKFDYSKMSSEELKIQTYRSEFPEILLKRVVSRKLTKNEYETFKVLLRTFDGNVEDLILVSKELS